MDGRPTAIDLFAGAGGATAGLRAAGFDVRAAVEIDPSAAGTYRQNHPDTVVIEADIRTVKASALLRAAQLRKGELTLLQACPPCQTWSSLGSWTPDDPRNQLVSIVGSHLARLRPRAFVIENVPGLRSDPRLAALIAEASRLGYRSRSYVVDASEFGVPQRRRRLIVLGVRGRRGAALPESLFDLIPASFDRTARTVRDAIGNLDCDEATDSVHRSRKLGSLVQRRIAAIPEGGSRWDLPEELQLECHRRLRFRNASASYGRMKADSPSPTLTTRCTTAACGSFVHPWEDRGITLREAAILQTFPSDYLFSGGYDSIERQIGNAIPVRLAEAAALAAKSLLPSSRALAPGQ